MTTYHSSSEEETLTIAVELASNLKAGDVVFLYGELGSGKTTFTRGIMRFFDHNIQVTSPTYSIINLYPTTPKIYHIDLYRIISENDLDDLGLEEYPGSDAIAIIEWAEKYHGISPRHYYNIRLEILSESKRKIVIEESRDARTGD